MQDSKNVLDEVTKGDYKYGFVTDIDGYRYRCHPSGIGRRNHPPHLGKETRTGVVVGFPPQGFPLLANLGDAELGAPQDPAYRLSRYYLLCRP